MQQLRNVEDGVVSETWPPNLPSSGSFRLGRARVPIALATRLSCPTDHDGFALCDIAVDDGILIGFSPAGTMADTINLAGGQVWPGFVDMHTHLDKAHIWPRAPNLDGSFPSALQATAVDRQNRWTSLDIERRLDFALRCAYAHGTVAIRTHIDSFDFRASNGWQAFRELRNAWSGRITLQGASIVNIDAFTTDFGREIADLVAFSGGILGAITAIGSEHGDLPDDFDDLLDELFVLATARDLDLDLHVDESGHDGARSLLPIARATIRHKYQGRVVCGHCSSLALQSDDLVAKTLAVCADAEISVVSLPTCNMYLQDRKPGRTPRWRGITLLHELAAAGIDVAVGSDNCRDPFYAFGDHDMLETFTQAVRIAHLDTDYQRWVTVATSKPASIMGLTDCAILAVGKPADIILFRARSMSELLSRSQSDRVVVRRGRPIVETVPDYRELDDLM